MNYKDDVQQAYIGKCAELEDVDGGDFEEVAHKFICVEQGFEIDPLAEDAVNLDSKVGFRSQER